MYETRNSAEKHRCGQHESLMNGSIAAADVDVAEHQAERAQGIERSVGGGQRGDPVRRGDLAFEVDQPDQKRRNDRRSARRWPGTVCGWIQRIAFCFPDSGASAAELAGWTAVSLREVVDLVTAGGARGDDRGGRVFAREPAGTVFVRRSAAKPRSALSNNRRSRPCRSSRRRGRRRLSRESFPEALWPAAASPWISDDSDRAAESSRGRVSEEAASRRRTLRRARRHRRRRGRASVLRLGAAKERLLGQRRDSWARRRRSSCRRTAAS